MIHVVFREWVGEKHVFAEIDLDAAAIPRDGDLVRLLKVRHDLKVMRVHWDYRTSPPAVFVGVEDTGARR